ncbi:MAG: ATP-binding protein, partial [Syntrophobacteraceae bacterium]
FQVVIEADGFVPRIVGHARLDDQPHWSYFDCRLSPLAVVSGQVTDDAGQPLPDVEVRIRDVATEQDGRYDLPFDSSVKTDADGRFRCDQLPHGHASVWVYKFGYCRPGPGLPIKLPTDEHKMVGHIEKADLEKEMMNEQVIEAGKLASIGELAAGIAHEINNPVAIMVEEAGWMEDLLEDQELQQSQNVDEFRRSLKQISIQGLRCKEITHKLLSFARKTDPAHHEIQVNDTIEEILSICKERSKFSNIRVQTELDEYLPLISASPTELQQVFMNLINNAIDAIGSGGGLLEIRSRVEGDNVVVDIADTGHGISKSVMARIFDPFFTTKPVGKGTGLGLSICYGIIKKLGGNLTVDSSVGLGTTFHVNIPIHAQTS